MDFDFTEEQESLRESAKEFLSQECPLKLVRETEDTGQPYARDLWIKIAELGWLGVLVQSEYGGAGGSILDCTILLEEVGRSLAPVPLLEAQLFGWVIQAAGSSKQRREFLPALIQGKLIPALAIDDWSAEFGKIEARPKERDGFRIYGLKNLVSYGMAANWFLVSADVRCDSNDDSNNTTLFLVERRADAELQIVSLQTIGVDSQAALHFNGLKIDPDRVLDLSGSGNQLCREISLRGAIGKCAQMVGGGQAVIDMTVEYVKQRKQFGHPIGSFQAIQHSLADMAVALDASRFLTYQAASLIASGAKAEREIRIAKAWVSDSFRQICLEAHQIHGAIGFTKDYDLQLFTRRAKAMEIAFGDAQAHYTDLAKLLRL